MLRACRRKSSFLFISAILTVLLSGCASDDVNKMTLGEWITLLDQKAGLSADKNAKPYYLNITEDSPYYEAVQAAAEWSVLDLSSPFDPDQVLTREWTAYTLVNLLGRKPAGNYSTDIRDLSSSAFPNHVSAAVAGGLLQLDSHGRFRPAKPIDRSEALKCLNSVTALIDSGSTDIPAAEYEFDDDLHFAEDEPETVDEEQETAVFSLGSPVQPGQYIQTGEPEEKIYKITETEEKDGKVNAHIEPAAAEEVFKKIEAADSFIVDFTTARIVDAIDNTVIQKSSINPNETPSQTVKRKFRYSKSHEINGYHISYSVTATGIRAEVTRENPSGLKVFGNLTVSSVKPSYRWKTENGKIKDGFFKMEFMSSENLGAEVKSYKELYGDFSAVDPKNFLGTIRNLFKEKKNTADITVPLMKIDVPVPSAPLLSVGMQLQLTIRASGKAQLALTQNNSIGMEIRDGHMRNINHSDMKAEASLLADTGLLGGVEASMKIAGMPIADIATEAGVTAKADAVIHLYDSENNHTAVKADDLPPDLVDDLADGNEGVLTCADIAAYKSMDIKLNSANTLAGRAGLSKTIELGGESDGALIPGLNGHIENGHHVSRCTRKDRIRTPENETVESDQIQIESYSLILDPGEKKQIRVKAIPSGYKAADLVFTSDSPSIAAVSGNTVTALKEGAAIIHIRTKDGRYEVHCSVLVRHKP